MVAKEPELAAELLVQALPAAAKPIKGRLSYLLVISDLATYAVTIEDGQAVVTNVVDEGGGLEDVDFRLITDARTFAGLAIGESQTMAVLRRRVRIKGKRWRALKLRKFERTVSLRDVQGAGVDPELLYRAMRYAIEPRWQGVRQSSAS
jgi:SCP-2 sterol transfer family